MQTALGEVNISSIDASRGAVRLYCEAELNRRGQRLAKQTGYKVKGIRDVIVIDHTLVLDIEFHSQQELRAVARSFMRAFADAIRTAEGLVGKPDIRTAMAVSSQSATFGSREDR